MQQMRLADVYTCPRFGQIVLEDLAGTVQLTVRVQPVMGLWLAHELKDCRCPVVSAYGLLDELLRQLGGVLSQAVIDASQENMPVGSLIIHQDSREIQQPCHLVDAIALSVRAQVPLYATDKALSLGSCKDPQSWAETVKPEDFYSWGALPRTPGSTSRDCVVPVSREERRR